MLSLILLFQVVSPVDGWLAQYEPLVAHEKVLADDNEPTRRVVDRSEWCVPVGTPTPPHRGGLVIVRWRGETLECLPKATDRSK